MARTSLIQSSLARVCRALVVASAALPFAVMASGYDYEDDPAFPTAAPAMSLSKFAKGRLGILDSTFERAYLVAAWRVLDGRPLSDSEIAKLQQVFQVNSGYDASTEPDGSNPWFVALQKYGAFKGQYAYVSSTRYSSDSLDAQVDEPLDLSGYTNCTLEATRTAAKTLTERATAHGDAGKNPWVAQWVAGQQQVFENCARGVHIPEVAPANAPVWFKQDRAYQRAAATFYVGRFDEAREMFDSIAKDKASPWSELAPYLAARSMLRKASLTKDKALSVERTEEARVLFESLSLRGTPKQQRLARALLARIKSLTQPQVVFDEAARRVATEPWDDGAVTSIEDFLTLVRLAFDNRTGPQYSYRDRKVEAPADGSMADWVVEFGHLPHDAPLELSYAMSSPPPWSNEASCARAERALAAKLPVSGGLAPRRAWTLACLAGAKDDSGVPAAVVDYVTRLKSADPAYATAYYHLLRLQTVALEAGDVRRFERLRGKTTVAAVTSGEQAVAALRQSLDQALSEGVELWGADGLNSLRGLRSRVANSVSELLQYGTLTTIGTPRQYGWQVEEAREVSAGATALHESVAKTVSFGLTTRILLRSSADAQLPETQRKALRRQAWVRAAVLDQRDVLDELTPALLNDWPVVRPTFEKFMTSKDPKERAFELALLLLKHSGFSFIYDEASPLNRDYGSNNWWCGYERKGVPPGMLSAVEQRDAVQEGARLAKTLDATVFIGNAVVAWSKVAPKDSRLAPALADVVQSTRGGCVQDATLSRRAFVALHKLFPGSPEAKATKYWY